MKKFLGLHASRPPNPLLAGAFFRAGEIEAWGRGVQPVFEACRQAGAPAPEVECEGGEVRFEFSFAPDYLNALAASPETSGKTAGKTSGKTRERIRAILHQRSQTTIPELAEELGKSTRAVEMAISKLTKEKMLRRIGPAKGGRWEVIKR